MGRFSDVVCYDLSVTKARGTKDTQVTLVMIELSTLVVFYSGKVPTL